MQNIMSFATIGNNIVLMIIKINRDGSTEIYDYQIKKTIQTVLQRTGVAA